MKSSATTVAEYLQGLPEDRRAAMEAVRQVILKNLDPAYEEGMQYGMIGYYVPHSVYPAGYHCDPKQPLPFAGLASQKNHMAVYLMCIYSTPEQENWFRESWLKTGKKLDMGKGCVRFKKLEDVPLEVIGATIARTPAKKFIAFYESARESNLQAKQTAKKAVQKAAKKSTVKKTAAVKKAKSAKKTKRVKNSQPARKAK